MKKWIVALSLLLSPVLCFAVVDTVSQPYSAYYDYTGGDYSLVSSSITVSSDAAIINGVQRTISNDSSGELYISRTSTSTFGLVIPSKAVYIEDKYFGKFYFKLADGIAAGVIRITVDKKR
jgi:hypothetical protein